MSTIRVVDHGSGNVESTMNALLRVRGDGDRVELSSDPALLGKADRLVLPGVGAFGHCRNALDAGGFIPMLLDFVGTGRPLLGICVGMQLLADEGLEFGVHPGLGLVPGRTRALQVSNSGEHPAKLPHVAWSQVAGTGPLFENIAANSYFYFVHSFILDPDDASDVAAVARYHEVFAAAVCRDNVFGVQFHPEKSGPTGLRFLQDFCRWDP